MSNSTSNATLRESAFASKDYPTDYVTMHGQRWFKISRNEQMPPFFMSGISAGDHWMFLSSCGALTAGRQNPDSALFPYYSSDKIVDLAHCTGPKTLIRVWDRSGADAPRTRSALWEPFNRGSASEERCSQNLYKNVLGTRFLFEEYNKSLGLVFRYGWTFGKRFGFIRSCELINSFDRPRPIELLDGIENLVPSGLDSQFQLRFSNLADAYKVSELLPASGIGLHYLSSIPTDRAEPSEGLRSTIVWQYGLQRPVLTISSDQVDGFRNDAAVTEETESRGKRHAFLAASSIELPPSDSIHWTMVADVNYDHSQIASLDATIRRTADMHTLVEQDVRDTESELIEILSASDAREMGADLRRIDRHQSNVLFNIMRGGIPSNGYQVSMCDLAKRIRCGNRQLANRCESFLDGLPASLPLEELLEHVDAQKDIDLKRIASEYLPLRFSRRHGDPTRPWNEFSIDLTDAEGETNLSYQGNWRDIFQNWEALSISFPLYAVNMVLRFVNATTADGYNPYRLTDSGFEWEVPEPDNPWSNIGYWGDHQIVYLLRLLQRAREMTPGRLAETLTSEQCVYANIPYRIRSHHQICENPFETIDFDPQAADEVARRVDAIGSDGRLLRDAEDTLVHVSLLEKLLVPALVKIGNFVPGGGIWLNTQRPEWNDANNALVGRGLSVVTTCHLRCYLTFLIECLDSMYDELQEGVRISGQVAGLIAAMDAAVNQYLANENPSGDAHQRRCLLDAFATAGSEYREQVYEHGFSSKKQSVPLADLTRLLTKARDMVDETIQANRRSDGLYHSYNLLELGPGHSALGESGPCESGSGSASVTRLYEMLEGQVAVLNSGLLLPEQAADLLDALRVSRMYRADQQSYMLYPDRKLSRFMEKNCVPQDLVDQCPLLKRLLDDGNTSVIQQDVAGQFHFHGSFRNVADLEAALTKVGVREDYRKLVSESRNQVASVWEATFHHHAFTGRSGTFFGYEGLGSIYWHMVSKLALAVIEQCLQLVSSGVPSISSLEPQDQEVLRRLMDHYHEIRGGLGIHKTPQQYGAFPQDPYSHTPENRGVQQPGMTGQVKEDILSRWHELGLRTVHGQLRFDPILFERKELLSESSVLTYYDLSGQRIQAEIPKGTFAFTYCQCLVVYHDSPKQAIRLQTVDGGVTERDELCLTREESAMLFARTGEIARIDVLLGPNEVPVPTHD